MASYGNEILKVCRLENGLEVEVYEPMPAKPTKKGATKGCCAVPYDEPWKAYAFETEEAALAFITAKLPGLRRKTADQELEEGYNAASAE
ncbi:MAG: hypothetical protein ACREA0_28045 [bacterium]